MRRSDSFWCLCAFALVTAGCAGYRLGPSNGQLAGAHSIQINPIINKTLEPRLGDYLQNSLRKDLQQDGTFRIDTHDAGDIVVTATILSYHRSPLSVQPTDVLTAVDYEITMTAQVTARDRLTGKVILDHPINGRTSVRVGNDLTSAEREAMPMLAEDWARKATAQLVDGSW